MENYLIHFGNKNSGRYPRGSGENPNQHGGNYTPKQRRQDERLYGSRAAKRIEKRVNNNETLISARHKEVVNRDRKNTMKKYSKKAFKVTASAGAILAGYYVAKHPMKVSYYANNIPVIGETVSKFIRDNASRFEYGQ